MDGWYERTVTTTESGFRIEGDWRDQLPLGSVMMATAVVSAGTGWVTLDEQGRYTAIAFGAFLAIVAVLTFLDGLRDWAFVDGHTLWIRRVLANVWAPTGSRLRGYRSIDLRQVSEVHDVGDAIVVGHVRLPTGISTAAIVTHLRASLDRTHREVLDEATADPRVREDAGPLVTYVGQGVWRPGRDYQVAAVLLLAMAGAFFAIAFGAIPFPTTSPRDVWEAQTGSPILLSASVAFALWVAFHRLRPSQEHAVELTADAVVLRKGAVHRVIPWNHVRSVHLANHLALVLKGEDKEVFGAGWPVQAKLDMRKALAARVAGRESRE